MTERSTGGSGMGRDGPHPDAPRIGSGKRVESTGGRCIVLRMETDRDEPGILSNQIKQSLGERAKGGFVSIRRSMRSEPACVRITIRPRLENRRDR